MIQIKINQSKTISPDGDRLYIQDVTGVEGEVTYVLNDDTDNYDAVTNTTGYGPINGLRSQYANFPVGVLKKSTGDVFCDFDSYDPLVDMEYGAIMNEDSRIVTYLISVPRGTTASLGSVLEGKAVYDTDTNRLLQKLNGVLVVVNPEDLIGTSYASEPYDTLFIAQTSLKKGALMRKLVDYLKDPKCSSDIKAIRQDYDLVNSILTGAVYEFWLGNKLLAQKDIEFLNSYKYINKVK